MSSLFRRNGWLFFPPLLALCVLPLLMGLSGCSDSSDQAENSQAKVISYAGKTVTLLVPADQADGFVWDVVLEEWEAETNGKTKVVTYQDTDALLETLQQVDNRANTIAFFPRQDFAGIGAAAVLSPIPETQTGPEDFNWNDLYDALRNSALKWDGDPAVFPIREPILLLYYRRDLLAAADLEPPRNWQEYRDLLSKLDQWAPGLSAVEPWDADFRSFMFLTHALPFARTPGNYSAFFDYSSGKPLIDTPGFVRGVEQSREILPLLDPQAAEMSPRDCLNAIRNGTAALAIAPAFATVEELQAAPDDREAQNLQIAAVPIPGASTVFDPARDTWRDLHGQVNRAAVSGWEGLFVGVAKNQPEENAAAWNLLRTLLIRYPRECFAPGVMTSTRLSSSQQPWSPEFENLDERSHVEAVRDTLRESELVPALTIAHREEFLGKLNDTVNRLIFEERDADAQTGLNELASEWSALMEKYGANEMRLSYAHTLGLRIPR